MDKISCDREKSNKNEKCVVKNFTMEIYSQCTCTFYIAHVSFLNKKKKWFFLFLFEA